MFFFYVYYLVTFVITILYNRNGDGKTGLKGGSGGGVGSLENDNSPMNNNENDFDDSGEEAGGEATSNEAKEDAGGVFSLSLSLSLFSLF